MPKPPAEIRITTGTIIGNRFFYAGEVLPFERIEDLPESLRPLIATGEEPPFYSHSERLIYNQQPGPEPGPVFFQQTGGGGSQWQARRVAGSLREQAWAEEQAQADAVLPPETQAALADLHDRASRLALAQLAFNARLSDGIYEQAEAEAAAKEARQQLYVRRGGEMGKVQNAKLRPGEKCFVRDGDEWVFAGVIDSTGEPPPQPIIT